MNNRQYREKCFKEIKKVCVNRKLHPTIQGSVCELITLSKNEPKFCEMRNCQKMPREETDNENKKDEPIVPQTSKTYKKRKIKVKLFYINEKTGEKKTITKYVEKQV